MYSNSYSIHSHLCHCAYTAESYTPDSSEWQQSTADSVSQYGERSVGEWDYASTIAIVQTSEWINLRYTSTKCQTPLLRTSNVNCLVLGSGIHPLDAAPLLITHTCSEVTAVCTLSCISVYMCVCSREQTSVHVYVYQLYSQEQTSDIKCCIIHGSYINKRRHVIITHLLPDTTMELANLL